MIHCTFAGRADRRWNHYEEGTESPLLQVFFFKLWSFMPKESHRFIKKHTNPSMPYSTLTFNFSITWYSKFIYSFCNAIFLADLKNPVVHASVITDLFATWACSFCLSGYPASVIWMLLQGVSHWNVSFRMALTDRNIQVSFCLKVSAYSWG